jgi:hypothetical protein
MRTLILFLAKGKCRCGRYSNDGSHDHDDRDIQAPVLAAGPDRMVPAGDYRVVTDEELIEGLSFPAYHRVSTAIFVPGAQPGSWEMLPIDPRDLAAAQERDREATTP